MILQLHIYEIFEHNKMAFHASRIMRTYGFNILALWETRTEKRTEFVYLLSWEVGEIEDRVLVTV